MMVPKEKTVRYDVRGSHIGDVDICIISIINGQPSPFYMRVLKNLNLSILIV